MGACRLRAGRFSSPIWAVGSGGAWTAVKAMVWVHQRGSAQWARNRSMSWPSRLPESRSRRARGAGGRARRGVRPGADAAIAAARRGLALLAGARALMCELSPMERRRRRERSRPRRRWRRRPQHECRTDPRGRPYHSVEPASVSEGEASRHVSSSRRDSRRRRRRRVHRVRRAGIRAARSKGAEQAHESAADGEDDDDDLDRLGRRDGQLGQSQLRDAPVAGPARAGPAPDADELHVDGAAAERAVLPLGRGRSTRPGTSRSATN